MTPENWKLVLAFAGLFLMTVTGPILWALRAESRRIQAEMRTLRAEIKADMVAMEARLNERIDTRLVHRL